MFIRRFTGILFLAALLAISGSAMAQLQTGNLYGSVIDNQGERLPGVTITLTGPGPTEIQVTNAEGQFRFLALTPGNYQVTAELEGFSTVTYPNVNIRVGRNTTLELTMTPSVEEIIPVTTESPLLDERERKAGTAPAQSAFVATQSPEARLASAGFELPEPTRPVATYVTWRKAGNLLFLSGHGECGDDYTTGKVGRDLTLEQGRRSAELTGLCMLATIRDAVGELSRVKQVVRILGMVNATEDFTDHPKVINGFSDLLVVAFGDAGKGARAAVGMASLPSNIAVEIEAIVELYPDD
ncbi:MAG: Atu1372/SO_1960 family protein [Wenzhouxiangellaceae bacterium]